MIDDRYRSVQDHRSEPGRMPLLYAIEKGLLGSKGMIYAYDQGRLDRILTRWRKSDVDSDLFGYRQEPSEPAPNLK
ncbi:hypothetical protein HBI95_098170 [Parastagonospora nodorum]|nr:hypothetical protein HBI95_098170 [Parastagonospora nodorum]